MTARTSVIALVALGLILPAAPVIAAPTTGLVAAAADTPPVTVTEVEIVVADDAAADMSAAQVAPTEPDADETLVADLDAGADRLATPPVQTDGVQTLGVTWPTQDAAVDLGLQVRTLKDGDWSPWVPVEGEDSAPDTGTADAENTTRSGTEAVWVGAVDAVQLSLDASVGATVDDLTLALVGAQDPTAATPVPAPTSSAAPTPTPTPTPTATRVPAPDPTTTPATDDAADARGTAATSRAVIREAMTRTSATASTSSLAAGALRTAAPPPRIISRAEWGAPAQVCAPDIASGLVGAAVHHTANPNSYSTVAEAMQMLRNDAAYHISSRGWCDLGYNFVVDKWGNIYEGRAGSMSAPVIGVHAGGFNTGTVGVSMLGTYDAAPSNATQAAVGTIIGYRLGLYRVDPRGTMSYTTGVGENSRFQNQTVTLPRVFGHRDVAYTACPGNGGYAALPMIRAVAWDASQAAWARPPSSLLRTAGNATVYLVANSIRYPIRDLPTMAALAPLGPVSYVSQQYLDVWPVSKTVKRVVRGPDGTVYFVDAGIRLRFGSCDAVQDYGMTCDDAIALDAEQIAALHYGGPMPNLYRTTSGKAFYVDGGVKHEVADDASLSAAGLPSTAVWLLESGIAHLPYGDPIVRPGLLLHQRGGARGVLLSSGGAVAVPDALRSAPGVPAGTVVDLDAASLARLTVVAELAPFVRDGATSTVWFVTAQGKARVSDARTIPDTVPTAPTAWMAAMPERPALTYPLLIKADDEGTISLVSKGHRKPLRSWPDLVKLSGQANPTYVTAAGALVRLLPVDPPFDPPATMIKAASDASVYFTDGADSRLPVSTFSVTNELGVTRLTVVADAALQARALGAPALRTTVRCGSQRYIGLGGRLWAIPAADDAEFPEATTALQQSTCDWLPRADRPVSRFLRTDDGTIFWISDRTKRPIGSYARFLELGGSPATMIQVSGFAASLIPTGARV